MTFVLFCNNGIGDKLLDIIGFSTYCFLINKKNEFILNDFIKDYNFGMKNYYNTKFFNFNNIVVKNNYIKTYNNELLFVSSKFNKKSKKYNISALENKPDDYIIPDIIINNIENVEYYHTVISYSPVNIYKILNNFSLEYISRVYVEFAENICPSNYIESLIPEGLEKSYGIHLRRTDKIKSNDEYKIKKNAYLHIWSNSLDEYNYIIDKMKEYILNIIKNNNNSSFFVCSEDNEYKIYFQNWIIENGGTIITIKEDESYEKDDEILPIVEMFCLSRCKEIIQGVKYSSYSITSALIGKHKKIINFLDIDDNFINIFKSVLNINNSRINLDIIYSMIDKYII
jgi:hypothetical protein